MVEKGLTYPSSKVVLQYLEANKRISLAQRCPSLQTLDQITPISVDYLYFGFTCTRINNTLYDIGVITHYPKNQKSLKYFEGINKTGGFSLDLDEFGCYDNSSNMIVNPGHIVLKGAGQGMPQITPEIEEMLEVEAIERLAELKPLRRMKKRQQEKDRLKAWLYTYELKKAGAVPPFSKYLQYTKKVKRDEKWEKADVERFEYSQKTYKSMEYLNSLLFKGRTTPLLVNRLEFKASRGVLRLPEGLKIKPRGIFTGTNITSVLDSIRPILATTGPLDEFGVSGGHHLATNYTNPVFQSAKKLLFKNVDFSEELFETLLEFQKEYIDVENGNLDSSHYEELMEKIVEDKRGIGTRYSFNIKHRGIVKAVFWRVRSFVGITYGKEKKRGCRRFPHVYNIPMDDLSKLSIYCDRNKKHNEKNPNSEPWILWFRVEKITEDDKKTKRRWSELMFSNFEFI